MTTYAVSITLLGRSVNTLPENQEISKIGASAVRRSHLTESTSPSSTQPTIDSSPPKYSQLQNILREQILTLQPHVPIPSEAELCRSYSVSRTTVRKAIDHLVHEGILYRVQGSGTFVALPKMRGRYVQSYVGFFEDATAQGMSVTTQMLKQEIVPANKRIANDLGLAENEPVLWLERLRLIDNIPSHISIAYVPHRLCPGIEQTDFTTQSLYRVMREQYDIQFSHGNRLVEARPSTADEAELLQIEPEVPLLVVFGAVYDANNVPVEYGIAKYRSDRSQLEVSITTKL
jgi:GntR family transcriptional regulator